MAFVVNALAIGAIVDMSLQLITFIFKLCRASRLILLLALVAEPVTVATILLVVRWTRRCSSISKLILLNLLAGVLQLCL
jgi:hypothetical protein